MNSKTKTYLVLGLLMSLAGCARKAAPLPGDSVSDDGGTIVLSPPRLSTAPYEAREATNQQLGPIESKLYPPELVMEHQSDLGITDDQKKQIIAETERGQSEMLRLQWELQGEKEKLVKLLEPEHVDEAKVQAQATQVMDRESKVKSSHLGMLLRVKNILTSDQQKKLREIRSSASPTASTTSSPSPSPSPSASSSPSAPRPPRPRPPPPPRVHDPTEHM